MPTLKPMDDAVQKLAQSEHPIGWKKHLADQSYCHRLQHDMYFLTSTSRLNEQVVDKIILQLNRVYPQILTNEEAEKFRNPKASLHTRLSGLLKHLQKKGDRHCQEFYRALQINAEQLFNDLPSRKILKTPDPTEIDTDKEQYMLNDRAWLQDWPYSGTAVTQKHPLVVALLWLLIDPSQALAFHG
ncbi:Caspase recruitment domain-containing protein 19 [Turdus rufiventris]|nr:Caspase recruitment domain-containing protein 19 [Turdus rufiventris]